MQPSDQGLNFASRACCALGQGAHFFGDHRKPASHFAGTGSFNGGVERQQVGLFSDGTDYRQHAADGGRLFGQLLDHLRVALHFAHQRMQPGQALTNYPLALCNRSPGAAAGIGRLTGVARHL